MCKIEIITGFISSGKTLFLNEYLNISKIKNEKIVVILMENGNSSLNIDFCLQNHIIIRKFNGVKNFSENVLKYIMDIHNPDRIVIEVGYFSLKYIDDIIKSERFRRFLIITSRIRIINSMHLKESFHCKNFGSINFNIVILNNYDNVDISKNLVESLIDNNIYSFIFKISCFSEIGMKFSKNKLLGNDFNNNFFLRLKQFI